MKIYHWSASLGTGAKLLGAGDKAVRRGTGPLLPRIVPSLGDEGPGAAGEEVGKTGD